MGRGWAASSSAPGSGLSITGYVPFLVAISLWALVAAHWSAALAAYAAIKAEEGNVR